MPVRPTVRCLREDLGVPVPPARVPLDEIDHPLLRTAQEQFAPGDTPHERIRAIDDVVLFKVKTGRWRGAVYSGDPESEVKDWLVAGGTREEGSPDDFYAPTGTDETERGPVQARGSGGQGSRSARSIVITSSSVKYMTR